MYEAARWHGDARFQSPMIIHMGAHIFIGDIVQFIDPKEELWKNPQLYDRGTSIANNCAVAGN